VLGGWLFFYSLHFIVGMLIPQYQERDDGKKKPADNKVQ
jgi:hypothetical protein